MTGAILLSLIVVSAIYILITWLIMKLVRRFSGNAASAIGFLAAAFMIFSSVQTLRFCAEEPKWKSLANGEEMPIFNCDAPLGVVDYLSALVAAPKCALILAAIALAFYKESKTVTV